MKLCSVENCDKKFYALNMCEMHYKRVQRHGNTDVQLAYGVRNGQYRHGMHGTKLYKAWSGMVDRCNSNNIGKKYYKDRGIKVCDEWQEFKNFYNDMGGSYEDGLTLDRKDNNIGYSKDNCRWVTKVEQRRNIRKNIFVKYNGVDMLLVELAEKLNIDYYFLYQRIYKYGMSLEDTINRPIRQRIKYQKKIFISDHDE